MDTNTRKLYTNFVDHLRMVLISDEFKCRHRCSDKYFVRTRCLPFVVVILILLNMLKRSLQDELDEFFRVVARGEVSERIVTKGAFTQARKKFKHTAFIELNDEQVNYFYTHFEPLTWKDKRLLATDGSMAELPNTEEICSHFGVWHPRMGGECPKARLSQLYDVLNKVTIHALISPKALDERHLAFEHFAHLKPDDLVLMDRGYPAFWLFKAIKATGAHFCARMEIDKWHAAKAFIESGKREDIITLDLCHTSRKLCKDHGLSDDPITLRFIRIDLPNQEVIILATSLLDQESFEFNDFQELYLKRWPVETDYRRIKIRFQVENWSGKTVESIYQDFHATIFSKNFAAILAQPTQPVIDEQTRERKHPYQVNMTNLFSKMKDTLVLLFKRCKIIRLLKKIWKQMITTIEPVRPLRSYERKKKVKPKRYRHSYNPIR